jgi:ubiquitin-conjugating enzyme E2 O
MLDPEFGEHGPLTFTEKAINRGEFTTVENNDPGPLLLHDVLLSELKSFEEFSEGDYIIYRQKLGRIRDIDRDAILLLPDRSTVSPIDPDALELPLSFDHENLVALPSYMDATRSYSLANGGTAWSVESEFVFPGQFCFTPRNNMSFGDWVSRANAVSKPEGHVIATPAIDFYIDWLCPNVFAVGMPYSRTSSEVIRASTLRGNAVKCDFGQVPRGNLDNKPVQSDTWLGIGDRVRFRDPIAAAAKYPAYQHIPANQSFGYDVNILRVTSTKSEVTVQWQDGTVTTEAATSLRRFSGAEEEVWPGELVVLKDGVETVREHCKHITGPLGRHMKETICVKSVGVVQTVDSRERIASIRWYENPDVKLTHRGNMLIPGSSLGNLSDTTTDVSIYELGSYSSMERALGDVVLLAPARVHQSSIPVIDSEPTGAAGPCQLSFLSLLTFFETFLYLENLKIAMAKSDWFKQTTEIDTSPVPSRYSVHHDEFKFKSPTNFVGQIISIDADGIITVRIAGTDNCRDVRIHRERIMIVIDEDDPIPPVPTSPLEMFFTGINGLFERSGNFSVSETIEYGGGERLDNGSGDEDWSTEDESELDDEDFEDIVQGDGDASDGFTAPAVSVISSPEILDPSHPEQPSTTEARPGASQGKGSPLILLSPLPSSRPPGFSLLEGSPPSEHHFLSRAPLGAAGIRVKRIQKEFEILQSSLPPGIFVRTWESRIDLLRVLILGPQGTPYECAPFVIDFHFPDDYPTRPPAAFFHSWTNRNGMINPNLEENGKICLSLLGTWPGKNPTESWSPTNSTVLQVLVSIMGLVLVKTPFYST